MNKTGSGPGHPVAGKNLNRSVRSKLQPDDSSFFPFGRAQHGHGGKQEANGGKLAFIRAVQAFSCHGCLLARPAFQFYSSSFYVTHRFFVSFLTQERNVTPSSPRSCPLSCSSGSAPRSGAKGCAFPAGRCSFAISPARRQPPFASSPARRPDQSAAA